MPNEALIAKHETSLSGLPSGVALLLASKKVRTAEELQDRLRTDPVLQAEMKKDPAAALAAVTRAPLDTDVWIYRLVVGALGLAVLIALVGAIVLALRGNVAPPDVLTALGSAAVGALAGLLAPSPVGRGAS